MSASKLSLKEVTAVLVDFWGGAGSPTEAEMDILVKGTRNVEILRFGPSFPLLLCPHSINLSIETNPRYGR